MEALRSMMGLATSVRDEANDGDDGGRSKAGTSIRDHRAVMTSRHAKTSLGMRICCRVTERIVALQCCGDRSAQNVADTACRQ